MTPRTSPPPPPNRTHILTLARTWLGTPYHHQASVRGVGCDCVGLVRGVYRALYGRDAEAMAPYTRDWAEATGEETLIAAARRHLIEIDAASAQPGDVLIFRYRPHMVAKHTAILSSLALGSMPHSSVDTKGRCSRAPLLELSAPHANPAPRRGMQSHLKAPQRLNIVPLPSGEGAGVGRSTGRDRCVVMHGPAKLSKVWSSNCEDTSSTRGSSRSHPHPTPDPSPEGRGDRAEASCNCIDGRASGGIECDRPVEGNGDRAASSREQALPSTDEPEGPEFLFELLRSAPSPLTTHDSPLATHPSTLTLIHALEGAPVSEVPFHPWWQRRIAAAFAFPGIRD